MEQKLAQLIGSQTIMILQLQTQVEQLTQEIESLKKVENEDK